MAQITVFVSLTFDDGNETQFTKVYPVLKKYNLKGTFYITTSQVGYPGKLNWEQIKKLFEEGHEIGSHTHTHPNLTKISDKHLNFELRESKKILKKFKPKSLAYPCGEFDYRVVNYTKKYYSSAKGYYDPNFKVSGGVNFKNGKNKFSLKCIKTDDFFKLVKDNEDNFWAIFTFHFSSKRTLYYEKLWVLLNLKSILKGRELSFNSFRGFIKTNQKITEDSLSEFKILCEFLSKKSNISILPVSEVIKKF